MSKTNILDKIKELFTTEEVVVDTVIEESTEDVVEVTEEQSFLDIPTESGVLRVADDLEVGVAVELVTVNEEGEEVIEVPQDGDYLVDGGALVVVADGVVSEVKEAEVVEEEEEFSEEANETETEENEEVETETESTEDEVTNEDSETETEVEVEEEVNEEETVEVVFATEESVTALTERLAEMETKFNETLSKLDALTESFTKFSKAPSEESTKTEVKFTNNKNKNVEDKIKFFAKRK